MKSLLKKITALSICFGILLSCSYLPSVVISSNTNKSPAIKSLKNESQNQQSPDFSDNSEQEDLEESEYEKFANEDLSSPLPSPSKSRLKYGFSYRSINGLLPTVPLSPPNS